MDLIHTLNIFDIASSIRRFYLKISFSPIHGILLLRHCYLYDIVTSTTLLPLRHCYLYDIGTSTTVVTNHRPFSSSVVVFSCLLGVAVVEGAQPRPLMNWKFHPEFREVRSLSDWVLHGKMA